MRRIRSVISGDAKRNGRQNARSKSALNRQVTPEETRIEEAVTGPLEYLWSTRRWG